MSGMHLSKEFFLLLKAIGESKSKQEEDRIIAKEVQCLKSKLESNSSSSSSGGGGGGGGGSRLSGVVGTAVGVGGSKKNPMLSSKKKAKEFLVRMLYVEMLGHDASFGYIKAVELAASSSIVHKRTGYLVCSSVLSPEHEFRFMLVNQMQRDLGSSNVLVVIAALLACTAIITGDMVPAISNDVTKLMGHASDQVRKKAVICLHRLHQIAPEVVPSDEINDKLRRHLCDRDPSVMGATLNVIEAMASKDPSPFKDLVPSLISILKQIIEHRLPSDYDYHRVPAPWMQLKIVRILALLGKHDVNASNGMYEMLAECLKRADIGITAGYAIVYECVRTITHIYPNSTLLDAAAEAISRFISSRSNNLKYMGITGLAGIVESHPQYAAAHQVAVIECLEDADETLQRRTLDLLYKMTNPNNVEFITEKMLDFLRSTTDMFLRQDLTTKICHLAERYAPHNIWYVQTTTQLFEISGDLIPSHVSQSLMTLIAEGSSDDYDNDNNNDEENEEADMLLRQHAVELYADLLDKKPAAKLPPLLMETMAWVLGEYAYLSAEYTLEEILEKMCNLVRKGKKQQQLLSQPTTTTANTPKIMIAAIMKLVAQAGTCPPIAARVIDDFTQSKDVDLQQRCLEFQNMLTNASHLLGDVLPVDASCEDVDVDTNLSFLQHFVQNSLNNGSQPYQKPEDDNDDDDDDIIDNPNYHNAFKMTPYEKPTQPGTAMHSSAMRGVGSNTIPTSTSGVSLPPGANPTTTTMINNHNHMNNNNMNMNEPQLNLRNVANVWGKGGLSTTTTTTPSTTTTTTTTPSVNASSSTSNAWTNSYTSQTQPTPTPTTPVKTEEQLRKEKMAAALFGGASTSTNTTTFRSSVRKPKSTQPAPAPVTTTSIAPPAALTTTTTTTAPTPAPAPIVDLLDFGTDTTTTTTNVTPTPNFDVDILTPSLITTTTTTEPPKEQQEEQVIAEPTTTTTTTTLDDPFASAGLLGGLGDTTLEGLMTDVRFEFNGQKLSPLVIDTAKFGAQWGTACVASSSISKVSMTINNLEKLMSMFVTAGLHKVETIAATNEGICAGMIAGAGSNIALVHAKVNPMGNDSTKMDITVKATDQSLAGCLSMYFQNMLR